MLRYAALVTLACLPSAFAGEAPFQPSGPGKPGANGVVPILSGVGNGSPGSPNTLILEAAPPGTQPLLVLGLEEFGGAFGGGILGPVPSVIVSLPPADAGGRLERRFRMPPNVPVGQSVWLQAWMRGGGPPLDLYAASNTLRLIVASAPGPLGTLLPSVTYATGVHSEDVEVVDLDGDGNLDMIVMNRQVPFFTEKFPDLVVLRGSVSGDFEPGQLIDLPGVGWATVKVEDLDADGTPEVLGLNRDTNTLGILTLAPDGTLALESQMIVGTKPFDVAVADFDADGVQDLVVANFEDKTLGLWRGLGARTFTSVGALACTIPPRNLAIGDFDGDGLLDLAVAGQLAVIGPSNNGVNTFRGLGGFDFAVTVEVDSGGNGASSVVAVDLDADGHLDLAVANRISNDVAVLLNDGAGGFPAVTLLPAGEGPLDIAGADLDLDGVIDLVSTNAFGSTVEVYWGLGSGTFERAMPPLYVTENSRGLTFGDVDTDGDLDILVVGSVSPLSLSCVTLTRNRGDRMLSTTLSVPAEGAARDLALGDLDQDGVLDAAFLRFFAGEVEVRRGSGTGEFETQGNRFAVGTQPQDIELADLNGDGLLDAVVASPIDDTVSVLLGDGNGGFAPRTVLESEGGPNALAVLDIDNDGDIDLAVAGVESDDVALYTNDGHGVFAAATRHAVGEAPFGIAQADLNEDGHADLVTANALGNTISLLFGSPQGFEPAVALPSGFAPADVSVGDMDADGDLDLAVAVSGGDGLALYLGNGDGTFLSPPSFLPTANAGARVELADLDLDGRADAIFLSFSVVVVRQAVGSSLLGAERFLPAGDFAWQAVSVGDVDNDGDIDIVALSAADNTLAVILNELFCANP